MLSGLLVVVITSALLSVPMLYPGAKSAAPVAVAPVARASAPLAPEAALPGLPARLIIPAIAVDAAILPVGLTPDGAMDTTDGPSDASWYKLGQRPGEGGTAVIAGHFGTWLDGATSVFDYLSQLRKGDTVEVVDEKGVTTTFVVRESRSYDPEADATEVFGTQAGASHLNLITCQGVWNSVSASYPGRLVVFTDRE